jgi:trimeric autotransporter adhesin
MKQFKKLTFAILFFSFLVFCKSNINAQGIQTFQSFRMYHPNNPGQYISLIPPNAITSYGLTLPAVQGAVNQILRNDGSGNLSWVTHGGLSWGLTGNTSTVDGTNFIGTTDNVPLNFRVNGNKSGRIATDGSINAFGYQAGASSSATFGNSYFGHRAGLITSGNNNTFMGYNTGTANVAGYDNTFIGTNAGYATIGGFDNTFLGFKAGFSNTSGNTNTFVGTGSGNANQVGIQNTFLGFESGNVSTATGNMFLGYQSGYFNTSGDKNIALGWHAGYTNVTGSNNTHIGYEAGVVSTSSNNHFIGYQAGKSNTSGISNTFEGYQAGFLNLVGNNNTFLGYQAGYSTTASSNVAIGKEAFYTNTSGQYNVAIGEKALYTANGGSQSVAIGHNALVNATIGGANVAIGPFTLRNTTTGASNIAIGRWAGNDLTGASNTNVFIGYNAGLGITTGSNNVIIGGVATLPATLSNNIIIGDGFGNRRINVDAAGLVGINTITPTEQLHVVGNILASGTITSSDLRFKKNIKLLENALTKVEKIRGVTYDFRTEEFPSRGFSKNRQIGFIAQELEAIFPEFVVTSSDGYKAVDYARLTPVLVESVKELSEKNDALAAKIQNIEQQLSQNTKNFDELKAEMASIKTLLKEAAAKQNDNNSDKK